MTRSKTNLTQTFKENYIHLLSQLSDPAVFNLYCQLTTKVLKITPENCLAYNTFVSTQAFDVLKFVGEAPSAPLPPQPSQPAAAAAASSSSSPPPATAASAASPSPSPSTSSEQGYDSDSNHDDMPRKKHKLDDTLSYRPTTRCYKLYPEITNKFEALEKRDAKTIAVLRRQSLSSEQLQTITQQSQALITNGPPNRSQNEDAFEFVAQSIAFTDHVRSVCQAKDIFAYYNFHNHLISLGTGVSAYRISLKQRHDGDLVDNIFTSACCIREVKIQYR